MSNEYYYDAMDADYCRDLRPVTIKLNQLKHDGNRYHYMLAVRLLTLGTSRFLVKPATGFLNPTHEAFFNTSWDKNLTTGLAHVISSSTNTAGYISGAVWKGSPLGAVSGKLQPIFGTREKADKARTNFEKWHLSGKSLRNAWKVQQVVSKMKAGDRAYEYALIKAKGDVKKVNMGKIQKQYPGWKPDDGSSPTLVVGSLI